ncbi:hypothetical protein [Cupriavidus basilensis]
MTTLRMSAADTTTSVAWCVKDAACLLVAVNMVFGPPRAANTGSGGAMRQRKRSWRQVREIHLCYRGSMRDAPALPVALLWN